MGLKTKVYDLLLDTAMKVAPKVAPKLAKQVLDPNKFSGKALRYIQKNPFKVGLGVAGAKKAYKAIRGDGEEDDKLLAKLKEDGVIGTGAGQMTEEEFFQHYKRGMNTPFSPIASLLELYGVGGVIGSEIAPFFDKEKERAEQVAQQIRQFQANRANRLQLKEQTGFELGDEMTLDDLYGKENWAGNAESVDFTSHPIDFLLGRGKKEPTYGKGEYTTSSNQDFKTEQERKDYLAWFNDQWRVAKTPEETLEALKAAPAAFKKKARFLQMMQDTYRSNYKGRDSLDPQGQSQFKNFVNSVMGGNVAARVRNTATGATSPNPAASPVTNRPSAEQLMQSYVSPDGRQWVSEDEYRQVELGDVNLDNNASTADLVRQQAATPAAVTPAAATPAAATPAAATPAAVAASAAQPKTVAQQQQEYLASKNIRTAAQNEADLASSIKDPNSAFNAAMARGGHNNARAMNMRVGKYANLDPDAFIPETVGVKGKGAVTYRERALGQHFSTPALVEAKNKGDAAQPFYRGGNWVGNNIVTGEFKDPQGGIWANEGQFRNSQKGESGMVETDERPSWMGPEFSWEAKDFDPIADAVRMGGLPLSQTGPAKPTPWTPEKGGVRNGRNFSRADSDPADFDPHLAAARKTLGPIFDKAKKKVNNIYGF